MEDALQRLKRVASRGNEEERKEVSLNRVWWRKDEERKEVKMVRKRRRGEDKVVSCLKTENYDAQPLLVIFYSLFFSE